MKLVTFLATTMALSATLSLTALTPAFAGDKDKDKDKDTKIAAATPATPDVTFPYSFTCPHCKMKITVKNAAEWKKDCQMCPCDKSNLGCLLEDPTYKKKLQADKAKADKAKADKAAADKAAADKAKDGTAVTETPTPAPASTPADGTPK